MKKIGIIAVLALVVAGGAYKTVLAKPAAPAPKPKVEGNVYVLPKEFLINLADGRYAKVQVALVIAADAKAEAHGEEGATPPEGYGTQPQEAIVRDLVTGTLTDASQEELVSSEGREKLKKQLLKTITKHPDIEGEEVPLPDVPVQ